MHRIETAGLAGDHTVHYQTPLIMSTDNEELQQYLASSALEEDSDKDLLEIPKTPEGKPDKDELDIQYSNEFDILSKPSSITT